MDKFRHSNLNFSTPAIKMIKQSMEGNTSWGVEVDKQEEKEGVGLKVVTSGTYAPLDSGSKPVDPEENATRGAVRCNLSDSSDEESDSQSLTTRGSQVTVPDLNSDDEELNLADFATAISTAKEPALTRMYGMIVAALNGHDPDDQPLDCAPVPVTQLTTMQATKVLNISVASEGPYVMISTNPPVVFSTVHRETVELAFRASASLNLYKYKRQVFQKEDFEEGRDGYTMSYPRDTVMDNAMLMDFLDDTVAVYNLVGVTLKGLPISKWSPKKINTIKDFLVKHEKAAITDYSSLNGFSPICGKYCVLGHPGAITYPAGLLRILENHVKSAGLGNLLTKAIGAQSVKTQHVVTPGKDSVNEFTNYLTGNSRNVPSVYSSYPEEMMIVKALSSTKKKATSRALSLAVADCCGQKTFTASELLTSSLLRVKDVLKVPEDKLEMCIVILLSMRGEISKAWDKAKICFMSSLIQLSLDEPAVESHHAYYRRQGHKK